MGSMTRKGQVYSVGNYLMTGRVFGKGHFARVEEATHRIIGKKVAIKIIDLTCIKEEYARRNLHREPRVMAKLRHPCIAALYETMMHGPRLYVVMEAACGGDLCAHVLAGGGGRSRALHGLPEPRAKALAAQLVSAVKHMHARGVVHRDLKMENIMLDATKQFIKIVGLTFRTLYRVHGHSMTAAAWSIIDALKVRKVFYFKRKHNLTLRDLWNIFRLDFGLSNIWSSAGALRTPCGSLEYAAPELFVDGRKYGPEVDLWSVGVIVYGMVTGALPFTGGEREVGAGAGAGTGAGGGGERAALRAAISRGLTRRQRTALAGNSPDCRGFIQQLLEPNVDLRMKIEDAAKHRWIKRAGMRMKTHPLMSVEPKINRDIYKQISDLCGQTVFDVIASVKAEPFGATAGMYNIKSHLHQIDSGGDLLWTSNPIEPRPESPPEYTVTVNCPSTSKISQPKPIQRIKAQSSKILEHQRQPIANRPGVLPNYHNQQYVLKSKSQDMTNNVTHVGSSNIRKPTFRIYDNGDNLNNRLPSIDEHSNCDFNDRRGVKSSKNPRTPQVKRMSLDEERQLRLVGSKPGEARKTDLYRRSGDGVPSWRSAGISGAPPPRILLQTNATTIKRASQGNIVSPHSSCNSHCKSERAMPVGWYAKASVVKEPSHFQRLRRTAPMK